MGTLHLVAVDQDDKTVTMVPANEGAQWPPAGWRAVLPVADITLTDPAEYQKLVQALGAPMGVSAIRVHLGQRPQYAEPAVEEDPQ